MPNLRLYPAASDWSRARDREKFLSNPMLTAISGVIRRPDWATLE